MSPGQRILTYINNKGITQAFISRQTGIDKSVLNSKLHGKTKLLAEDVELICGALDISPTEFLTPTRKERD